MCYSFKTSIISYIIGLISAFFAVKMSIVKSNVGLMILGMLILFYVQIQFSEALIWKGIDDKNIELNKLGTFFAKYTLPSHLIGIGLGVIIAVLYIDKRKLRFTDFIPLIIGILFYLSVLLYFYKSDTTTTTYPVDKNCMDKSCQNNSNRLVWNFPYSWYLYSTIIAFIILFYYITPLSAKISTCLFFSVGLLLSYIIYKPRAGTVWCFMSAVASPLLVLMYYLLI